MEDVGLTAKWAAALVAAAYAVKKAANLLIKVGAYCVDLLRALRKIEPTDYRPYSSAVLGGQRAGFAHVFYDITTERFYACDLFNACAGLFMIRVCGFHDFSPRVGDLLLCPERQPEDDEVVMRGFVLRVLKFPDARAVRSFPPQSLEHGVEVCGPGFGGWIACRVGESHEQRFRHDALVDLRELPK